MLQNSLNIRPLLWIEFLYWWIIVTFLGIEHSKILVTFQTIFFFCSLAKRCIHSPHAWSNSLTCSYSDPNILTLWGLIPSSAAQPHLQAAAPSAERWKDFASLPTSLGLLAHWVHTDDVMQTDPVTGFPLLSALLFLLSSYIEITALMNSAEAPDDWGSVPTARQQCSCMQTWCLASYSGINLWTELGLYTVHKFRLVSPAAVVTVQHLTFWNSRNIHIHLL